MKVGEGSLEVGVRTSTKVLKQGSDKEFPCGIGMTLLKSIHPDRGVGPKMRGQGCHALMAGNSVDAKVPLRHC